MTEMNIIKAVIVLLLLTFTIGMLRVLFYAVKGNDIKLNHIILPIVCAFAAMIISAWYFPSSNHPAIGRSLIIIHLC